MFCPMKSLQGQLLIASPKMGDPNFHRTVVLIVQHGELGAVGLILNRPLETTIDMVWDKISDTPCLSVSPLLQGGPCEGALMVLHGDISLSEMQVVEGVYFSTDKESVEQLVAGDFDERPVRFFVGYAGWSADQLETEIEAGKWFLHPASADHIFETYPDLWDMLRRKAAMSASFPWLKPKFIPDDPSVN